ncbi:uncharacterized protein LOC116196149 [Punica granatum]|uniref:Sec-independent protein translocase protein TatB-like n=2 Tax=Punica granatum TaxID=22663 RepID=A0A218WJF7_PUNGR|nr:uncharacterized protein LOC116196149 [Punica granatum]OWM72648.1 hypothetical protein CDL15_Pgr013116 [Punica granatum]PKI35680.1 hypothetical protein CRG98_043929 [Punica granatum]
MLGISYGELFLILGATAALIGPKDLPLIARTAGRLAGRAIGYVQLARGQFDSVMQQTQARQVHKELQDTMAQLEAIRHEIRSISFINPGPMTRRLIDDPNNTSVGSGNNVQQMPIPENKETSNFQKDGKTSPSDLSNLHSQATAYDRLADSAAVRAASGKIDTDGGTIENEAGFPTVLPISAETAGFLSPRTDDVKGSDIVLEAIVESEVAHNAKEFFARPENQIKYE